MVGTQTVAPSSILASSIISDPNTTPNIYMMLPAGRKNDVPWIGLDSFQFTFSEPVLITSADVVVKSARGINYGPVTVTNSGTSDMITLAHPIDKADRVTFTIDVGPMLVVSSEIPVLPGDVLDRGRVTAGDIAAIRKELRAARGRRQRGVIAVR